MIRIRLIGLMVLMAVLVPVAAGDGNPARRERGSGVERDPGNVPRAVRGHAVRAVSIDPSRGLGEPTATLALIAFGDYQCSYCRHFDAATLPELVRKYVEPGVLRYFHKDFPLSMHPQAAAASIAAYCAASQGRYWQMHRRLYQQQDRLGDALFTELATELSLDAERFNECRAGSAPRQAIQRDLAEGRALGVSATPTFILGRIENDRVVVERMAKGVAALDVFAREIEALRAATGAPPAVKPPNAGAPASPQ